MKNYITKSKIIKLYVIHNSCLSDNNFKSAEWEKIQSEKSKLLSQTDFSSPTPSKENKERKETS